jgi:hypothetical protein
VLAVTSFSAEGYKLYGKTCLETFVKHWPCRLIVFYEVKPEFEHPLVEYRYLYDIEGIRAFLEKLMSVDGADGRINGTYSYTFDASRFCRKVFSVDSVFDEDGLVFWLDADTKTLKDIPREFLESLLYGLPFCYLGRERFRTETGFIGFNTTHPDFKGFRDKYRPTYTSGEFINLPAWEDTAVFDHARKGIVGNNLNKTALQGIDHCFPHTVLGEYIEHYKGRRKLNGN